MDEGSYLLRNANVKNILYNQLVEKQQQLNNLYDIFLDTIHWTEPFIVSILWFHIVIGTVIIWTRKNRNMQLSFFILLFILTLSLEFINQTGSKHWRKFTSQNYFDENGIFISILVGIPFILFAVFIFVYYLYGGLQILLKIKKSQIEKLVNQKKDS